MDIKRGGQFKRRATIPTSSFFYSEEQEKKITHTPADRIPFSQMDILKNITSPTHGSTWDINDLITLMEAEETDILLQERKWEQQYPEWTYEKESVKHALVFYQQPENAEKIFEVTFMHDGSMKTGYNIYGTYIRIPREKLHTLAIDVNKFMIERTTLEKLIKVLKRVQKGNLIDGQFERPAIVEYLTEKVKYWQTKQFDREQTPEEKRQWEKNEQVYAYLRALSLKLRTQEDR